MQRWYSSFQATNYQASSSSVVSTPSPRASLCPVSDSPHTPLPRPPRVLLYALQSLPSSPFCSSLCSSKYKPPRPAGAHEVTLRRPLCAPTSILFAARHLRYPRITTRRPKSPSPRVALQYGHHPSPRGPSNKLLYALTHIVVLKTPIALSSRVAA